MHLFSVHLPFVTFHPSKWHVAGGKCIGSWNLNIATMRWPLCTQDWRVLRVAGLQRCRLPKAKPFDIVNLYYINEDTEKTRRKLLCVVGGGSDNATGGEGRNIPAQGCAQEAAIKGHFKTFGGSLQISTFRDPFAGYAFALLLFPQKRLMGIRKWKWTKRNKQPKKDGHILFGLRRLYMFNGFRKIIWPTSILLPQILLKGRYPLLNVSALWNYGLNEIIHK